MTKESAKFTIANKEIDLPIRKSTLGPDVVDVSGLYNQCGYFTYDPGFLSTASCASSITYVDGDKGILNYRGYDVKGLCENKDFMDVAYLLINNKMPSLEEKSSFSDLVVHHTLINERVKDLFKAFAPCAHPMSMMLSSVGFLASIYPLSANIQDKDQRMLDAIRVISKVSTIACMIYKHIIGQAFMYPKNELYFTDNILHMLFSTYTEKYEVNPAISKALDAVLILHADHEQNASTSAVRSVGSTNANIYACIASGISGLWGYLHGGANEQVIQMLEKIGRTDNINAFISKVKDKEYKLMGFGHRVYKSYDPRAEVLKKVCKEILSKSKLDYLLEIALQLEDIALRDEYFISRKLYPNVDFYSGLIYRSIGIPSNMFTVMFALARTVGWVSQWMEMHEDSSIKINRPRQLYIGNAHRKC